ncbi:MAG TPA: hypothetical protein VMX36_11705 [Sedimentisphaerales bacterium]|nr:hypothetical protein [Sedimentisphaerales bacterium]
MWSGQMMVLFDELPKQSFQMTLGKVFTPVQGFRKHHPEQAKTWSESWLRAFLRGDPVFTGGEPALYGRESGGQHGLGAEDGPQEKQGISEQLASATKHMTEACQKGSYGIHAAGIIESTACSKFT